MHKKIILIILVSFLVFKIAIAAEVLKLYPSTRLISNLTSTLNLLKQQTDVPILFPRKIPRNPNGKKYFIYTELTDQGYRIYIDDNKDCKGVHSCNIGIVSAEKNGKPEIYTDRNNKVITVPIILPNKTQAFFTPAHAMGDYWPTNLQWQNNQILYSISWQLAPKTEREIIIAMAANAQT
jgi:hypothetical protein